MTMAKNRFKILIVEDEANIRTFIRAMLEAEDYQVLCAPDCAAGISMFSSHCPDLVILDLGLPDQDGSNFITYARRYSQAPILVLSARTTDDDKVTALDLGANDYVTKPFSTAELLARVRSALRNRRYSDLDGAMGDTFDVSDLHIDFSRRLVTLSGREIRLTQTEYNIVTVLAHHAGRVMTYAAIIRAVWGTTDEGSIKKLQVNLANIRKKLGERPGDRRYISNELGVGYRMISDEE